MDDYLSKPIRFRSVMEKLASLFAAGGPITAAAAGSPPAPVEKTTELQIDWGVALGNLGGDRGLLREVTQICLDELPPMMEAVRAATEAGGGDPLRSAAHALKGSILFLGDTAASREAERFEVLGKANQNAEAAAALSGLEAVMQQLRGELAAYLKDE